MKKARKKIVKLNFIEVTPTNRLKVTSRIKSLDKTNGDCERPSLILPLPRRLISYFYSRSPGFVSVGSLQLAVHKKKFTVARQRRNIPQSGSTGLPYNSRYPYKSGPGHRKIVERTATKIDLIGLSSNLLFYINLLHSFNFFF